MLNFFPYNIIPRLSFFAAVVGGGVPLPASLPQGKAVTHPNSGALLFGSCLFSLCRCFHRLAKFHRGPPRPPGTMRGHAELIL